MASARRFDIVVYGATGFTGRLIAKYLADKASTGLRVALAGRSADKLERLRAEVMPRAEVMAVDATREAAVRAMASSSRVVIAAAGPYLQVGLAVARACVAEGTHYVDITGETPYVQRVIDELHEEAERKGVVLVPMCGFDSVPSDLGVYFTVRELSRRRGLGTQSVRAFVRGRGGGISGGTAASLLNIVSTPELNREVARLDILQPRRPAGTVPASASAEAEAEAATRAVQPTPDRWWFNYEEDAGVYAAPWPMEGINTRVVRRSAALFAAEGKPYTESGHVPFTYNEWSSSRSWLGACSVSLGSLVVRSLMAWGCVSCIARFVPTPGEGPSDDTMRRSSFEFNFLATPSSGRDESASRSSSSPTVFRTTVSAGYEGYLATAVSVSEGAIALVEDLDRLPGRAGGVLTPATAFGGILIDRLAANGFRFEVRDTS